MEIECAIDGCTSPAIVIKNGFSLCEKHDKEAFERNQKIQSLIGTIQHAQSELEALGVQLKQE